MHSFHCTTARPQGPVCQSSICTHFIERQPGHRDPSVSPVYALISLDDRPATGTRLSVQYMHSFHWTTARPQGPVCQSSICTHFTGRQAGHRDPSVSPVYALMSLNDSPATGPVCQSSICTHFIGRQAGHRDPSVSPVYALISLNDRPATGTRLSVQCMQ